MNDSFEDSTYDWENASIGEDTAARESDYERIKLLQDEDENKVGDGVLSVLASFGYSADILKRKTARSDNDSIRKL